jgi:hypothetical protein
MVRAHLQLLLNNGDGSSEHASKVSSLQKKICMIENFLNRQRLSPDFSRRLEEFVEEYDSENKGEITFEVAPMQADQCVAGMLVTGDVDFIISGDSDFAMYVGPNGRTGMADIMLKDVHLKKEPI